MLYTAEFLIFFSSLKIDQITDDMIITYVDAMQIFP
jgi:hypothetical protein